MINSEIFYDKSIAYAISAIEIYNKPVFNQRSEVFSILLINAWEALLKGKILLDANEEIRSLYIDNGKGGYKANRAGSYLTIDILGCAKKLELPEIILDNLHALVEIRDASIHFVNKESVDYLVYTLGTASLKNYHRLCKKWFGEGIDKYNFYILPMGFIYSFKSIELIELKKEPTTVQDILKNISKSQSKVNRTPYEFVCEIEVNLKSAKRLTENTDLIVAVNNDDSTASAIIRDREIVEKYPLTATELFKKVKERIPNQKRNDFFRYLKKQGIKDDPKYSGYLFSLNNSQNQNYHKN